MSANIGQIKVLEYKISANIGQIKVLADKDKYIYYNGSITVFTCI